MPSPLKDRKFPPEPLSPAEVHGLLAGFSRRAPTGVRNRALVVLLWRAGLRISEALALEMRDLDRLNGVLRVRHGKGDKCRVVGLDPDSWSELEKWLVKREKLKIESDLLFCTLEGKPVSTSYVRAMLPRMARRAGITKRVHAHGLRHTLAFELAQEGVSMYVIQHQLGHANLSQTDHYVRHLNPSGVVATMQRREWKNLSPAVACADS